MTTDTDILKLRTTIKKAAKSVAFIWPGIVEEDDAEQMITLHLLERPNSITKIIGMDRAAQYRAVVGIGHQLASQERADYDYFKGSYRYSVKEVKSALQAGVLVEEFDHFHEVVFDLNEALESLAPQYADAIRKRYGLFEEKVDKDALSRGLTALTNGMNKSNKRRFANRLDGPGTRKRFTAEQARYESKKGWDDESKQALDRLVEHRNTSQAKGRV